jgi:hypothetical protein
MNTEQIVAQHGPRESMEYDVVVVGAARPAWPRRSVSSS